MYDMLTGQDNILLLIGKAFILPMLMIRLECTHGTWMPLLGKGDLPGNFAKCLEGPNEHPADCMNRLMRQIHCQVNSSPAGEILVRQLAYENAKADCKMVMCPFKRGRHIWRIRACWDVGSSPHQAQAFAAAMQKAQKICVNCGSQPYSGRVQSVSKNICGFQRPTFTVVNAFIQGSNASGLYLCCNIGNHWASQYRSKFHKIVSLHKVFRYRETGGRLLPAQSTVGSDTSSSERSQAYSVNIPSHCRKCWPWVKQCGQCDFDTRNEKVGNSYWSL